MPPPPPQSRLLGRRRMSATKSDRVLPGHLGLRVQDIVAFYSRYKRQDRPHEGARVLYDSPVFTLAWDLHQAAWQQFSAKDFALCKGFWCEGF